MTPSIQRIAWLATGVLRSTGEIIRSRLAHGRAAPSQDELIRIDPRQVEYLTVPSFSKTFPVGSHVCGGDWDRNYSSTLQDRWSRVLVHETEYTFYRSLQEFHNGAPWARTVFGRSSSNPDETATLLNDLTESLRTNGYLTQSELNDRPLPFTEFLEVNREVAVCIGRDGDIFFDEGKHRFFLSKILGISPIPVHVVVRHKGWQQVRNQVQQRRGVLPSNLQTHPDLESFRS